MREIRTTPLMTTACLFLCLIMAACGSADADDPGSGAEGGTPTAAAASPTSEPVASPSPVSISIADLTTLDWQLTELDGAPIRDGSIVTMTFIPDNRSLVN